MKVRLKQLEGKVIGLFKNKDEFLSARLKIDLLSSILILILIFLFSYIVYRLFIFDVQNLTAGQFADDINEDEVFNVISRAIIYRLIIVDIPIFIASILILDHFVKKMLAPLKDLSKKQKDFAEVLSHEIRTPLSIIQLNTDLTKNISTEKVVKEKMELITKEISNIKNMASDLLYESRVKHGEYPSQKLTLSEIQDMIEQSTDRLIHLKNSNVNVEIINIIKNKEEVFLKANKNLLQRVLDNLISNAFKYTKTGFVKISLSERGRHKYLEVQDTGIGISEEDLKNIFNKFYTFKSVENDDMQSVGLGLSIVKSITDRYDWKISVDSKENIGTKFQIRL